MTRLEKRFEDLKQCEEQFCSHIFETNNLIEKFFSSDLEKISILHCQQMTEIEILLTEQMKIIQFLSKELQQTREQIGQIQQSTNANEGGRESAEKNKKREESGEEKELQKILQNRNEIIQKYEKEFTEKEKEQQTIENQLTNDTVRSLSLYFSVSVCVVDVCDIL